METEAQESAEPAKSDNSVIDGGGGADGVCESGCASDEDGKIKFGDNKYVNESLTEVNKVKRLKIVENHFDGSDAGVKNKGENNDIDNILIIDDKIFNNHDINAKKEKEEEKREEETTEIMDPYRELELYLEKVNEEIGEIIESVPSTPVIELKDNYDDKQFSDHLVNRPYSNDLLPLQRTRKSSHNHDDHHHLIAPRKSSRRTSNSLSNERMNFGFNEGTKSLPTNGRKISTNIKINKFANNKSERNNDNDWSDNILAEFNSLIANEIDELRKENKEEAEEEEEEDEGEEEEDDDDEREKNYKQDDIKKSSINNFNSKDNRSDYRRIISYSELLNEFGISDSEGSECNDGNSKKNLSNSKSHSHLLNSDYDEPRDKLHGYPYSNNNNNNNNNDFESSSFMREKSSSLPPNRRRNIAASAAAANQFSRGGGGGGGGGGSGGYVSSDYDEPCGSSQLNNDQPNSITVDIPKINKLSKFNNKQLPPIYSNYSNFKRKSSLPIQLTLPQPPPSSTAPTTSSKRYQQRRNNNNNNHNNNNNNSQSNTERKFGSGSISNDNEEPDYDDVHPMSKSHETIIRPVKNNIQVNGMIGGETCPVFGIGSPKSAPVTPTEEKRSLQPFAKFLLMLKQQQKQQQNNDHRHDNNYNNKNRYYNHYYDKQFNDKGSSKDSVVLVRVSSLPDQDVFYSTRDSQSIKNCQRNQSVERISTKDSRRQIRSVSPALRSDASAKRLSESDKDVRRISPVELKRFDPHIDTNNVAVSCDLNNDEENLYQRIEHPEKINRSPDQRDQERSGSLPISLQSLLSRLRNGSGSCCPKSISGLGATAVGYPIDNVNCSDMGTQTSPPLSRCSSLTTWVSDCDSPRAESTVDSQSLRDESTIDQGSPRDTVDDDNRSSSSSQDLLQSMDEISSGSLSPEVNYDGRDEERGSSPLESGIGTASPPPSSTERRLSKPPTNNKCNRKETWERLRRRPSSKVNSRSEKCSVDVWVRRESVHTQTRDRDDWYPQDAVDSSSGLDDSLPRIKPPRPTNLPLGLSTAGSSSMSSAELLESPPRAPSSPSAASLQLKNEPMAVELGGKSSSAPLLDNGDDIKGKDEHLVITQPRRSQSERHLSEIEAQEACKWLRAAGFPQYAQMYEDYQFPIEVSGVAKDHPFLDADSLQSLFRRLHALNRCANMKLDTHHSHHHHHHTTSHSKPNGDDSDEDNQCALSENWTFEKKTRRWSRVGDVTQANVDKLQAIADANVRPDDEEDSLEDRLEAEEAEDTMLDTLKYGSLPPGPLLDDMAPRFRRTGSERLRESAKAFLRRVESLKSRRRKRQNREGVVISGPQVLDVISMQQKMKDLNCVDVSPTGPAPVSFNDLAPASPLHLPPSPLTLPSSPFHLPASPLANNPSPFGDDSSSYCSDGSQGGGPVPTPTRTKVSNSPRRFLHRGTREDQHALSDSECQPTSWKRRYFRDANSNHAEVVEYVNAQQTTKETSSKPIPINNRGGSLNLGKESQRYRDKFNQSQEYSRYNLTEEKTTPVSKRDERLYKSFRRARDGLYAEETNLAKTIYREKSRSRSSELAGSQESSSTVASRDSDQEEESPRHKGSVVRWHSFQRGSLYPEPLDPLCPRAMASMSCGQLLVLRKLALLKLTACMERYCPTHRTGWNWELPKFIRKIKTPDYKDKTVFGVPLLLSLQRTGQALPKCIQIALRWLRANALDQIGIFRKSGLRSRIQTLKVMTETQGDSINFDGQQAFDVADLVKQYFRELPESLLTNKLSETFIAIFQHVPAEIRPDAVQCVLLLLPDEHREALEALLDFLNHVASNAPFNQMTASNLAVCLAPSLFHFNHTTSNISNRSNSVSPRRRKTVGIPDQRELSENKAANDCLLYLIKTHRELFMVSSDMLTQCHFNYMEESVPVGLEELGSELKQDWRGYLYACTTALLKEAREKSRGWVSINNPADPGVEVAYKKVGDGHPLRLWRASTEVEAPPNELLHRVLRERHIWDGQLLKYRLVNKLDANVEVFQYATGNMSPLPARDYCVLRSWRNDLPKGACVIVETSVEHPDAPVMLGGTRGIVLASRYLIEPCGSGKSRIMHLSRVDTKGRTPDWYNKSYGHICALHLSKIRNSFKHTTDGPESKV